MKAFGVIFGLAIVVLLFVPSAKVSAAGATGPGGTGSCDSGCSGGGHYTWNGWGWGIYPIGGNGPSDGFRNGQLWDHNVTGSGRGVKQRCQDVGASSVYVFVILNGTTAKSTAMGYTFLNEEYGPPRYLGYLIDSYSAGTGIDAGRATLATVPQAKAAFNSLPDFDVDINPPTMGVDVGWFCYDFQNWQLKGTTNVSQASAYPDTSVQFDHYVRNLGPTTAKYSWHIQKNYAGAGWSDLTSAAAVVTASGVYKPGPRSVTITIPPGAANGAKYCQRIYYTRADGVGTGVGTSNGTGSVVGQGSCVTVVRPSASCSVDSIAGDGPGGRVLVGAKLSGTATLSNTTPSGLGAIPDSIGGHALEVDVRDNASPADVFTLTPAPPFNRLIGSSISRSFNVNNNRYSSPYLGNVTISIRYSGLYNIGTCSRGFPVYQYFKIDPFVTLAGNMEDPRPLSYTVGGDLSSGSNISATTSSNVTLGGGSPANPKSTTDTYGTGIRQAYAYTPLSVAAGQVYCANVTINFASGYAGPSGYPVVGGASATKQSCSTIHNEPYLHIFNSDASTGGGFGSGGTSSCITVNGQIKAYTKRHAANQYSGAGAQFGAIARGGPISGFTSSLLRTTSPNPLAPVGLSFTNTGVNTADTSSTAAMGGNFDETHCVPDYFSKSTQGTAPVAYSGAITPATASGAYKASASTSLHGASIADGKSYVLYVDGNLTIDGDVIYTGRDTWDNLSKIPSLYVIVKGNIFITSNVKQLDGIYIAQPKNASTGNIYTCSAGGVNPPTNIGGTWLQSCTNQLVVNGAFVAQSVKFQRTGGSLRNSNSFVGEKYKTSGPTHPCEESAASTDCASEIFRFSPEIMLGNPAFPATSGTTSGKFDRFTSLSPVL